MNDANIIYQRQRREHTWRKFQSLNLPDLAGQRYLDLGCNSGAFCEFALEAGAVEVAGVDISPELIDFARENLPKADFYVSRFEEIDLGGRIFDVITIASAIHYSKDFLRVCERIFNHLAPDGLLVIEGGVFDPLHNTLLNTPIPNWRQVGDHCRHLSMGFVRDVLFPDSTVSLVGPSLQQGGDNLSRYALQVQRENAQASLEKRAAVLDIEGFVRALAVSYSTIQPKYGISKYMEALTEAALLGLGNYDRILANTPELAHLIASEATYCISDWGQKVRILDAYGTKLSAQLADILNGQGLSTHTAHRYALAPAKDHHGNETS